MKCPFCAEEINDAAIKCKHCGSDLNTQPEAKTKQPAGENATADNVLHATECKSSTKEYNNSNKESYVAGVLKAVFLPSGETTRKEMYTKVLPFQFLMILGYFVFIAMIPEQSDKFYEDLGRWYVLFVWYTAIVTTIRRFRYLNKGKYEWMYLFVPLVNLWVFSEVWFKSSENKSSKIKPFIIFTIIMIICSAAIPIIFGVSSKANTAEVSENVSTIERLEFAFYQKNGRFGQLEEIGYTSPESKYFEYTYFHDEQGDAIMVNLVKDLDNCKKGSILADLIRVDNGSMFSSRSTETEGCKEILPSWKQPWTKVNVESNK